MNLGGTEPSPRDNPAWFVTTHWSQVKAAAHSETGTGHMALARLCATYWYPLYAYVRRRGYTPEDAQDLTQEFFARLLSQHRLGRADSARGRFRSFLLGSMNHFLADEWDKRRAQKRGGGGPLFALDSAEARYSHEPVDRTTPEQIFEQRWALALLEDVLARLKAEYTADGKADLFDALSPCLTGERQQQSYATLGSGLGLSESALKSAAHRLRSRYRTLLRDSIAQVVSSPDEIDEELNYLFSVLAPR